MPAYQQEHKDRNVSSQKQPNSGAAGETAARSYESPLIAEPKNVAQFRFRLLVVDDESSIRETARMILGGEGYEVLTAADGLEGLQSLSRSSPDLIISDLNMPRMTGFEFLAIVRQRFPHIATIAISGGYNSGEMPAGILADAFLQKGNYTVKELSHEVGKLLAASPLRSEGKKSDIAPLFVPRDVQGT
jgi:CheY-like chemotaxis protein